jgi:hypothetical protein
VTSSDEATSLAVTVSTGALGGRVGRRLADRRHRPAADPPPACEGAELAVASSYGDEGEMRAALEGMESPKGVIRGPAGEGRLAPVSRDDLADVATAILTVSGEHDGKTYELTGPELLGVAEFAERLSTYTGSALRYAEETVEEAWESRRPCGAPDREIEGWVSSYLAMADGSLAVKTDAVETSPATPRRRSSSASMPIPNSWAAGNPPRDPAAPAQA